MLTKPKAGWTDFHLEGCGIYGLSYLDDIAFEWLEQAIFGLETMNPFCVKGFLEPNRFLCTVSYWNCHIIVEDDERYPLDSDDVINEFSHTSMIEFCKYLYEDISMYIDEWASFVDYREDDIENKKSILKQKVDKLQCLIAEKEERFGKDHCFL